MKMKSSCLVAYRTEQIVMVSCDSKYWRRSGVEGRRTWIQFRKCWVWIAFEISKWLCPVRGWRGRQEYKSGDHEYINSNRNRECGYKVMRNLVIYQTAIGHWVHLVPDQGTRDSVGLKAVTGVIKQMPRKINFNESSVRCQWCWVQIRQDIKNYNSTSGTETEWCLKCHGSTEMGH